MSDQKITVQPSIGRTLGIIVGDLIMFGLFAAIGRRSHSEPTTFGDIVQIAAPFAIGWLAVAPWFKLFRPEVYGSTKIVLQRTAAAWALAAPVGLALRTLGWGKEFKIAFAITTFLFNLVLLLAWRGWTARKLQRQKPAV
ncbi:MAG: DUF3054 domain-containing protein [Herpetosiphonaceae bacterium]|nr:DUF3054 domain-containing protein [Herpetosiphonaceae bacterium]